MPQLQVLDYRKDPQTEMIANQSASLADTINKQQSLKMTGQYYKILAKNAQTEQDRAHMERLSKLNSDILPQIAATTDPTTKAMLIKAVVDSGQYGGDAQQFFHDIAQSQPNVDRHYQALKSRNDQDPNTPNPGAYQQQDTQPPQASGIDYATPGQLAAAQVNNQNQEANLNKLRAHIMQNPSAYMQQVQSGMMGAAGGTPDQGAQGGQPQNNGISNSPIFTGGTFDIPGVGQASYTNPHADFLKSRATAAGTEINSKEFEQAPAKASMEQYLGMLHQANAEVGGPYESEGEAQAHAVIAGTKAQIPYLGKGSILPSMDDMHFRVGNTAASAVEHGRPNLTEVQGIKQSIPFYNQSRVTQKMLTNAWKAGFTLPKGMSSEGQYDSEDSRALINHIAPAGHLAAQGEQAASKMRSQGKSQAYITKQLENFYAKNGYAVGGDNGN